jgi:hypothetical protein
MLKLLKNDRNTLAEGIILIVNLHIKNKGKKHVIWVYHWIIQETLRPTSIVNCQK